MASKAPKKANLLDHHSIKHILDESVSEVVTNRGYVEDVRLSNARLFIGAIIIIIALFAQFYNKKFPENRDFLFACIALYVIFIGLLQLIIYTKEKNAILFTYPPVGSFTSTGLVVCSELPRFSDMYTLTIASADPKSISANYKMDDFATAEEQIAFDKLREKFHEVNVVAQTDLATVQEHVNYTCQKAFFKCTYECYTRCTRMEDTSNCVENCRIPLTEAQEIFAKEKAIFQEKLNASFMMCLRKYEEAKLQQKPGALSYFISCTEQSYQESINMMPHLANKLKASFGLKDNDSF